MVVRRLNYIFIIIIYKLVKVDIRPYLIRFFLFSIPFYYFKFFKNGKYVNADISLFVDLDKVNNDYQNDKDKRKLWEHYRFNRINSEDYSNVQKIDFFMAMVLSYKKYPFVVFENMMEGSLRVSNLIYFLINNQSKVSDECFIRLSKYFIKQTFLLNIIAPDMYITRKGLRLRDESNNHYIFCMVANVLCLWYLNKCIKKEMSKLSLYLEIRFTKDGFLKEGSTYYSFAVVEAVLKMYSLVNYKSIDFFGANFRLAIDAFISKKWIIEKCNFGDRDDTRLLPALTNSSLFKEYCTNISMSYFDKKYFNKNALTENISHFSYRDQLDVVINHRQVEGFGTLGHYHDDYGQVNVYYKGAPIIVDPGTISYASYSTMLDTCNFHNMPYVKGQESLKRIAKFEKYFPASVSKYTRNGNVSVQSYDQYGKKKRVLFTKELEFLDTFSLSGQTVINFYIPIDFSIEQKTEKNLIILTNNNLIISFASSSMSGVNIYTSFMAQGYSKKKSVKVISFSFNDFNNPNKFRWSIKIND